MNFSSFKCIPSPIDQPPKSVHVDEAQCVDDRGINLKTSLKYFVQCLALMSAFSFNHARAEPNISWGITITGGTPPPVMRDEPIPPPRAGYAWIPGYWNWQSGSHVWVSGRWERQRTGYVYAEPVWREGPKGWELHRGGWRPGGQDRPRHGGGHCPPGQQNKGHC